MGKTTRYLSQQHARRDPIRDEQPDLEYATSPRIHAGWRVRTELSNGLAHYHSIRRP
jgi:hypothetical protein